MSQTSSESATVSNIAPAVDPAVNTHIGLETETMVIFGVLALLALCVDIWAHRKDKPIALKAAIAWTLFWICVSMCFAGFLYFHFNGEVASLFLAGYLFEQALSVDNLFVMMAIFAWFKVPEQYCHRVPLRADRLDLICFRPSGRDDLCLNGGCLRLYDAAQKG